MPARLRFAGPRAAEGIMNARRAPRLGLAAGPLGDGRKESRALGSYARAKGRSAARWLAVLPLTSPKAKQGGEVPKRGQAFRSRPRSGREPEASPKG